jgi:hypothetical protein
MKISFNKYQVYIKASFLIFILLLAGVFIYFNLTRHMRSNIEFSQMGFLFLVWTCILWWTILMIFQLIFLPKGLFIDDGNRTLTLSYFFHKPLLMRATEISEYSIVYISTKSTRYKSFLMYNSNGRAYLLSEFNLEKIDPIQAFLEDNKILFVGEEKFSFVKYFMNYF